MAEKTNAMGTMEGEGSDGNLGSSKAVVGRESSKSEIWD